MMKYFLGLLSVVALFMTSCSKDEVVAPKTDSPVLIHAQIQTLKDSDSRANVNADGTGTFENGDVISLLCNQNQYNLTLENGTWTSYLDWSNLGSSATFSGFYPAKDDVTWNFTHTVIADQRNASRFEAADLLHASAVDVRKGDEVKLSFGHLMSCITVNLLGDKYTASQLENATIKMRAYNEITVHSDGTLGKIHDYDYDKSNMSDMVFRHMNGSTYQLIVCPQNPHKFSYSGWWLSIEVGGDYHFIPNPPANLSNGESFNMYPSGKNTTLNYRFDEVDNSYANQTLWVNGVSGIPSVDSWRTIIGTNLKELREGSGSGWYDCDKLDITHPTYNDHRLCWAATSSNLIHWWLDRNSSAAAGKDIPHTYNNHLKSEVFQVFKDSFTDEGSFIDQGLYWYFLGDYMRRGSDSATLLNTKNGGYFKGQVSKSGMLEVRGISSLGSLDSALKYAFNRGQAIGMTIYMKGLNNGGKHAMTIWGAKFNKLGRVCQIYYCDNNDGADISDTGRMVAANVKEIGGLARLQGSSTSENYTIIIEELTLLNP